MKNIMRSRASIALASNSEAGNNLIESASRNVASAALSISSVKNGDRLLVIGAFLAS